MMHQADGVRQTPRRLNQYMASFILFAAISLVCVLSAVIWIVRTVNSRANALAITKYGRTATATIDSFQIVPHQCARIRCDSYDVSYHFAGPTGEVYYNHAISDRDWSLQKQTNLTAYYDPNNPHHSIPAVDVTSSSDIWIAPVVFAAFAGFFAVVARNTYKRFVRSRRQTRRSAKSSPST